MGKEKELLEAVRTKNVELARKIVSKLKKSGAPVTCVLCCTFNSEGSMAGCGNNVPIPRARFHLNFVVCIMCAHG